jgi:hypothetical protein
MITLGQGAAGNPSAISGNVSVEVGSELSTSQNYVKQYVQ